MTRIFSVLAVLLITGCAVEPTFNDEMVERGRTLYGEFCQSCHGNAATGDQAVPGAPSHGPEGHTWHHADGQLAEIILGQFDYPGRVMPSFDEKLNEEEVAAILEYFKTNWTAEQVARQAEVSQNWERLKNSDGQPEK